MDPKAFEIRNVNFGPHSLIEQEHRWRTSAETGKLANATKETTLSPPTPATIAVAIDPDNWQPKQ